MSQGQILGQDQILAQGHVQGHDRGQGQCLCVCGCIWLRQMVNVCVRLHLALRDVYVDSADGASSGLIR